MAFLGFVGAQPAKIPYQVFNQLASGTGFGGSTLSAAKNAVGFGITRAAGYLGLAGAGGFLIGQQILESIEYDEQPLTVRQLYKTDSNQGNIRVTATAKLINTPVLNFDNVFPSPVVMPVAIPATGGTFQYGAFVGPNAQFVGYFQAAPEQIEQPFTVVTIGRVDGQPLALRNVPVPAIPTVPYQPVKVPVTVPVNPGIPDFPITPTVIPLPEPTTPEEEKQREPGVLVQIPELGIQLGFYPSGVSIGQYRSPATTPFEEPRYAPPPTNPPPATDPCPCDEGESKEDEIICRIKTLQDEILDDGYTTQQFNGGPSNFIERSGLPDEFYLLKVGVASKPKNVPTQSYEGGAPTVYYTGWVSWKFEDRQSERIRLEFDVMEFKPPPGCTGFVLASNRACTHTTQAFTRKKKDYVDVCDGFVLN